MHDIPLEIYRLSQYYRKIFLAQCISRGYHRIIPAARERTCIDCHLKFLAEPRNIRHAGIKRIPIHKDPG